jgi:hypothetical protein
MEEESLPAEQGALRPGISDLVENEGWLPDGIPDEPDEPQRPETD